MNSGDRKLARRPGGAQRILHRRRVEAVMKSVARSVPVVTLALKEFAVAAQASAAAMECAGEAMQAAGRRK